MTTLYIIGNGFDRQHGLKTSYWDFRIYLEKYAQDFLMELEEIYDFAPFEKLDKRFKHNKIKQSNRENIIYNELWKEFEHNLGEASDGRFLDFSDSIVSQLGLEGGLIGVKDTLDQYWEEQYEFIKNLNYYLRRWIRQVRLYKAKPLKIEFLHNVEDYFFTFNYTNVLERIYKINNNRIIHIHGGLSPYCETEPVLGHGNYKAIEVYREKAKDASKMYDEANQSIYNAIANYYERTWKNTNSCLKTHDVFYDNIKCVDKVEIIGHSFGNVDLPYFNYLKQRISDNAEWCFYCHTDEDIVNAKSAIKEMGLLDNKCKLIQSAEFWSNVDN